MLWMYCFDVNKSWLIDWLIDRLSDRCNYFHRRCAVFSRYWPWWCVRWLRWHFSVTRDHCIYRYSMDHMPVPVSLLLNPCNYILHRCETSSCLCIMIVAHTWTQNTDIEQYVNNTVENVSTNLRWFIIFYHFKCFNGRYMQKFWDIAASSYTGAEITF